MTAFVNFNDIISIVIRIALCALTIELTESVTILTFE